MATTFKNPLNAYTERSGTLGPFLGTLFFGPIYLAIKGCWGAAVLSLLLAAFTAGLSWLIFPFFTPSILRTHYLRRGWIEVG